MSELNYWRHRWSPQHITTVDMTGTINAPQWEPVRVLSDAELAALVTPTREQIAEALWCFPINAITLSKLREKAATGNGDYEETLDYLMHQADAVLVLMRAQAGEARAANP